VLVGPAVIGVRPTGRGAGVGGSVFFATLVLITGAQLTTALKPVVERAAEPLPGGHLTVAGHPVVAYVAVSLCGLVFTVAVTSRFLGSIAIGLRDFEIPRAGQYFWACLPYVIALGWSARQSGLAFGCASTPSAADRFGDLDRQSARGCVQQGEGRNRALAQSTASAALVREPNRTA
jgi:hypothetical protein